VKLFYPRKKGSSLEGTKNIPGESAEKADVRVLYASDVEKGRMERPPLGGGAFLIRIKKNFSIGRGSSEKGQLLSGGGPLMLGGRRSMRLL